MEPKLREMSSVDVGQVFAIECSVSEDPWSEKLFYECVLLNYSCWVVEIDGKVYGYGIMSCVAGEAHILNIAIHPDTQGQKFGLKVMQHLIEEAKNKKAESVYLEVRESNNKAINLYKKLSFVEIGIRKGYYKKGESREDALVLILSLG